jgi:hypothetical protein
VLDAGRVGAIKSSLSAALDVPNGPDDCARMDTISALEELACVVTAAQAALSVELDESQRAEQADAACPRSSDGGPTDADNGQGPCEACNHAKQPPGLRARPSPDAVGHEITTTTPTGHVYGSSPPVLATTRGMPIRIDLVLAGDPRVPAKRNP